jgi:hypothetical protein
VNFAVTMVSLQTSYYVDLLASSFLQKGVHGGSFLRGFNIMLNPDVLSALADLNVVGHEGLPPGLLLVAGTPYLLADVPRWVRALSRGGSRAAELLLLIVEARVQCIWLNDPDNRLAVTVRTVGGSLVEPTIPMKIVRSFLGLCRWKNGRLRFRIRKIKCTVIASFESC